MKISLLVADFSINCLGRAYILAKILSRRYDVEVIGPRFGPKIWPPADTGELVYKVIPARTIYPHFIKSTARVLNAIDGQVLYALKPFASSYGLALLSKLKYRLPLVLDIDDWEIGGLQWNLERNRKLWWQFRNPNWVGWTYLLDKITGIADKITVSNHFLAKQYGSNYMLPHGQDVNFLDPANYEAAPLKAASGFTNQKVILFLGTPRPHKGLEALIKAVQLVKHDCIKIVVVGANLDNPYTKSLLAQGGNMLHPVGMISMLERPKWLALADMVVLPQPNSSIAKGQIPAKLFDAMAMAKPIVATDVSDTASILANCGFVVPPDEPKVMAERIRYVLDNPQESALLGQAARRKCVANYSWDVMEQTLLNVFSDYE